MWNYECLIFRKHVKKYLVYMRTRYLIDYLLTNKVYFAVVDALVACTRKYPMQVNPI